MGLITLVVAGVYASHLTTRLEHAINPPRSRAVEHVNSRLIYNDMQLSQHGENVVTSVHTAAVLVVFMLVSLPFILLGVASAGIAIPLIVAAMIGVAVIADSLAMWVVWRVVERESR